MFLFHEIILFILLQSLKMHLSSTFNFAIYLFHTMVKCLKEILKQPKLVFKNPVNLCHTKVNKSKLVLKPNIFHLMVKFIKQIVDMSILV